MTTSDGRATSAAQEGRARSSTSCQHRSHMLEVALKSLTERAAPSNVLGGGHGASSPCCPALPAPCLHSAVGDLLILVSSDFQAPSSAAGELLTTSTLRAFTWESPIPSPSHE